MTLQVSEEFRPTRAILDKARRAEPSKAEYNARALQGFVWGEDRAGRVQELPIDLPWDGEQFTEAFKSALETLGELRVRRVRYGISYEIEYTAGKPVEQKVDCDYDVLRVALKDSPLLLFSVGNRQVCAGVMGHPRLALLRALG